MNSSHLDYVRHLVRERSGIVLDRSKEYLVETRLAPISREMGTSDVEELVSRLRRSQDPVLSQRVVEALTTNETSFFRDLPVYTALEKEIVPDLIERRRTKRRLRIWSGACSTGQEPYSLALMLRTKFPQLAQWDIEIVATDLNQAVLDKAASGVFTQLEVNRGLPAPLLVKHFKRQGREWRIADDIRRSIRFQAMNLTAPWPRLPTFDLVLIRNVLIYFDDDTKRTILDRVTRVLRPDGWFLLGGAESVRGLDDRYHRVAFKRASAYRLEEAEKSAA